VKSPGRMLCNNCYADLGATRFDEAANVWLYECPECPGVDGPLTVEVPGEPRSVGASGGARGIMAELGIYDGLKQALGRHPGRWLEFGVVEHLYAQVDPDAYRTLVERYGHVAIAPDSNTASWMIGRALWSLKRSNEVLVKGMPHGTGRWDYLSPCNAWTLPSGSGNATVVTWEAFAEDHGFSARSHPAIDWRDTPNAEPVVTEPEPEPAE
jgi:hypothetical protein